MKVDISKQIFPLTEESANNMIQVEESYLNHLIYISEHDELTGVLNRYGIKKRMDEQFEPEGEGFLCMVDVDHFKTINDVGGHQTGDLVLRAFAQCLCGIGNSLVARLGGDEFFVYVGGVDTEEGLRKEFAALEDRVNRIDVPGLGGIKVTFSIGAYYFRGNIDELKLGAYTYADALCYESKKQEGNSFTIKKEDI